MPGFKGPTGNVLRYGNFAMKKTNSKECGSRPKTETSTQQRGEGCVAGSPGLSGGGAGAGVRGGAAGGARHPQDSGSRPCLLILSPVSPQERLWSPRLRVTTGLLPTSSQQRVPVGLLVLSLLIFGLGWFCFVCFLLLLLFCFVLFLLWLTKRIERERGKEIFLRVLSTIVGRRAGGGRGRSSWT